MGLVFRRFEDRVLLHLLHIKFEMYAQNFFFEPRKFYGSNKKPFFKDFRLLYNFEGRTDTPKKIEKKQNWHLFDYIN